jgi:ABC-type uncharacterized transport system permease subunit
VVKCGSLIGQKTAMVAAVLLAVALALLLLGMSYVLFPEQPSEPPVGVPIPKPEPLIDQLFWAIQWIGLAAFLALAAVGVMLFITRTRSKNP